MAVISRFESTEIFGVWKDADDARSGSLLLDANDPGFFSISTADCQSRMRVARAVPPVPAQSGLWSLRVEVALAAEKVDSKRPIEWIALLHGPGPAGALFLRKLDDSPVLGPQLRTYDFEVPAEEIRQATDAVYLVFQIRPGSPALRAFLNLAWVAPDASLEIPAAPHPEAEAPAVAAEAQAALETVLESPLARRIKPLPNGSLLIFKTKGDAEACDIQPIEGPGMPPGALRVVLSDCQNQVRLIRALPTPPTGPAHLPPGTRIATRVTLLACDPKRAPSRSILWGAITRGPDPVRVEMYDELTPRPRATGGMQAQSWDIGLDPAAASDGTLYATVQIAAQSPPLVILEPETVYGAHLGAFAGRTAQDLRLRLRPGIGHAQILMARGAQTAVLTEVVPSGGAEDQPIPIELLRARMGELGWRGPEPVELLLLVEDLLVDRLAIDVGHAREEGRLLEASPRRILGWAAREGAPSDAVDVEVIVAGEPFLTLPARQRRAGRPGGEFETRLLLNDDPAGDLVQLRSARSGQQLGEPILVQGLPGRLRRPDLAMAARALRASEPAAVSILVPVRDGDQAALRHVLQGFAPNGAAAARLLLLDCGCTDTGLRALLASAREAGIADVLALAQDVGLAQSLNLGIEACAPNDVVLLSPQALAVRGWLPRLRRAAYAAPDIASASALAGLPEPALFAEWEAATAALFVAQTSGGLLPDMPQMGAGCVYLRRGALNQVGPADPTTGSGWRVDWSMRARYRGFRHVLDDGCLVAETPAPVGSEDLRLLGHRYPELPQLAAGQAEDPALASVNHRLLVRGRRAVAQRAVPRPRCLFVISTRTGGTPLTNRDLMRALEATHDPFLLHCDGRLLTLSRLEQGDEQVVDVHELAAPVNVLDHRLAEYDGVVGEWLAAHAIALLHVRHLAWHSLGLIEIAKALGIPVVLSFHDFYTVCPTVKLLDAQMTPCGGICTAGEGDCRPELWPPTAVPPLRDRWVHNWRAMMRPVIEQGDAFVASSQSAKETILRSFPALSGRRFEIIPHGRDFPHLDRQFVAPRAAAEPLRVLILGNISRAKGADLIARLGDLDVAERFELHLAGDYATSLKKARVFLHGPYDRDDFIDVVERVRPHVGAVLSVWPETFSHSLTELWSAGLPVLGFDLGAVGERIRAVGGGWLLEERTAEAVHAALTRIEADDAERLLRAAAVDAWRSGDGGRQGTGTMAARYQDLYGSLI